MKGFKNVNVYIEGKGIVKSDVLVENGKIKAFEGAVDGIELDEKLIVVPGFIDKHIHGSCFQRASAYRHAASRIRYCHDRPFFGILYHYIHHISASLHDLQRNFARIIQTLLHYFILILLLLGSILGKAVGLCQRLEDAGILVDQLQQSFLKDLCSGVQLLYLIFNVCIFFLSNGKRANHISKCASNSAAKGCRTAPSGSRGF